MSTPPLNERLALVTGGSRGIGLAIAERLAAEGAHVLIAARGLEGAQQAAEKIVADGGRAHAIAMDVSDDDSVADGVKALQAEHGKIGILVHNAGITRDNLLLRMKPDDWNAVLQTNLTSAYRLSRALVSTMLKLRHGRIVHIGSVVATMGNPGQANYCAAKAGLEGFTRSLAKELGSRNVTVNCVAPGFIDTDMTRGLDESARAAMLDQVPLGRLGTPEDVAAAVAFLVGPGGDYVTGTTLHVNGGMSM